MGYGRVKMTGEYSFCKMEGLKARLQNKEDAFGARQTAEVKVNGCSALKKWFSVAVALAMPFLFGMNMTVILVIKNALMVRTPAQASSGSLLFRGSATATSGEWDFISSIHSIGALVFVALLFAATISPKFDAPSFLKRILLGGATLYFVSNVLVLSMAGVPVILLARFLAGMAFAITCGLCTLYYRAVLADSPAANKLVCCVHNILINFGIFAGNMLQEAYMDGGWETAIFISTGLSALAMVLSLFIFDLRKNKKGPVEREPRSGLAALIKEILGDPETRANFLGCLAMHVIQQLTGVNALIMRRDAIFIDPQTNKVYPGAHGGLIFFGAAGILGATASVLFSALSSAPFCSPFFRKLFEFKNVYLATTSLSALGYLLLIFGTGLAKFLGPGVYLGCFATSLGLMPWISPAELLSDMRHITMAISLGSMINWGAAFATVQTFPKACSLFGPVALYSFYAVMCEVAAFYGYYLLSRPKSARKASSERSEESGAEDIVI